ncbi:MAG TPA: hypothetical protein PLD62_01565 [Candidatus Cloacimonadota bacterium]|nr:hypothetical protein [Candidatus Cloacimonadota bacterium]
MKETIKFILILIAFSLATGLFCQNQTEESEEYDEFADIETANTFLAENIDYHYELIKFYLNEHEFDLALSYLDSIMINPTDSLYYFKGIAFKGKENWHDAADNFALAMENHHADGLLQKSQTEFKYALNKLPAMEAITSLSGYMNAMKDNETLAKFLVIMAEIYENNQLFDEANDVYVTLLKETNYPEQIPVQMKIATNQILLEQYDDAIKTLTPIVALDDSLHNADALFLYYLANFSLDRLQIAKQALLKLYYNYPHHQSRTEILSGLAMVLEKEGQFVMSWYFLNELKNSSSEAQKFIVQKDIDRLKQKIGTQKITTDQFRYLEPHLLPEEKK